MFVWLTVNWTRNACQICLKLASSLLILLCFSLIYEAIVKQFFGVKSVDLLNNFGANWKFQLITKKKKKCAVGFIKNYGFPCIGACDGFHVYVSAKLKDF